MATMTEVMPGLTGNIRESATWSIVLSVLMMISGVLAISIPPVAGLAVTVMFGWLLIVTGALHLGYAWRGHGAAAIIGEILLAILYAVIGIYALAHPVAGLATLTLAIAAYLVAKGVVEGLIAFTLRQFTGSGWLLVDSILTIAIAAMIANTWPVSAAWAVGVLVGVSMISSGFSRLMVSIAVRRLAS
ncbi:MAG TPA: HdeD family acid-resistance protein [Vicinamibacterales bacterium]|jgi:uncharacterized membrane protein HdeD (DUF308 family)